MYFVLRVGRSVGGVMKTRKPPTFVLSYIFYIPTIVSPSCVVTCLTVLLRHSYSTVWLMASQIATKHTTSDLLLVVLKVAQIETVDNVRLRSSAGHRIRGSRRARAGCRGKARLLANALLRR